MDPPVTLDLTWMDGLQGILRDGELTPVFDRSDGVNPVGDRHYGATTTDLLGVEISFRSTVDSYKDDVNSRYGHALAVHPYCLPMLKALLARVDPDFNLGIAYRLFRLMSTVQGIYRKPEGCDYELYGDFKHLNGLDDRDALPYVVLSHDYDSWIFAPYMNPDPIATLDSPVVVGSAQRDFGNQVIPLLTLPDEILVTILSLVPMKPHYLYPGNQYIPPGKTFAFEHIMALQSSCSAVRNRFLNQGVAASFYRDFAKPYWTISRIRLADGTLLDHQTTNKDTFETTLAKVHPWKWVSSCIKSDSSWNKHRVMMAFYRIVPFLQNMVDEQGDWVWPVRGSRFFFAILEILKQKDLKCNRWPPDSYGYHFALSLSLRRNLLPLSKWMIAHGALDGQYKLWDPLLYAARSGSIDIVQWVMQERVFVTFNPERYCSRPRDYPVDEALRLNHYEIADYIFKVAQSEPALSYALTNNAIVFHGMGNDDPQLLGRWLQDNRSPREQCRVARDAGECLNVPITRMLYENGVNLSDAIDEACFQCCLRGASTSDTIKYLDMLLSWEGAIYDYNMLADSLERCITPSLDAYIPGDGYTPGLEIVRWLIPRAAPMSLSFNAPEDGVSLNAATLSLAFRQVLRTAAREKWFVDVVGACREKLPNWRSLLATFRADSRIYVVAEIKKQLYGKRLEIITHPMLTRYQMRRAEQAERVWLCEQILQRLSSPKRKLEQMEHDAARNKRRLVNTGSHPMQTRSQRRRLEQAEGEE
ncbi:hypothetical protein HDU88_004168 [Geranomyces variabilis]|nr:hypothetical protein HDU88_004168 [Geranomyces variabilis]